MWMRAFVRTCVRSFVRVDDADDGSDKCVVFVVCYACAADCEECEPEPGGTRG